MLLVKLIIRLIILGLIAPVGFSATIPKSSHAKTIPSTSSIRASLLKLELDPKKVDAILDDPRLKGPIIRLKNSGTKTWGELESTLLSKEWIQKGRNFTDLHTNSLEAAERIYGIPKEILVGVAVPVPLPGLMNLPVPGTPFFPFRYQ